MTFGGQGDVRQDQGPTDRAAIENAMMASYNRHGSADGGGERAVGGAGPVPRLAGWHVQRAARMLLGEAARQAYLASGGEERAAQQAYNQAQPQRFQEAASRGEFSNAALQQMFAMGGRRSGAMRLREPQLRGGLGLRQRVDERDHGADGRFGGDRAAVQPGSAQGIGAAPSARIWGRIM